MEQRDARIDVNSWGTVGSAIILGTIGVLSFIVQPGLVQGFVSELGQSEADANFLATAEMAGVALATVVVAVLSHWVSWRKIIAVALVLAVVGNIGSALASDLMLFRIARFVTGLGEGGVISLSFAVIGLTARPERNLALYLVLLLTYGAVGLWAMPRAFDTIGLNGVFLAWAGMTAAALLTVPRLPSSADHRTVPSPTAAQLALPLLGVALLGVLVYNTAIGVAWANLFLIGMEIRPDEQAIANALLLAQFVAIAGALVSVFMEARLGRWLPIVIGIFGGAAFIWPLLGGPTYVVFAVAVSGFNFLWNMVLPFILSAVGDMDRKGRMMTAAIAMQMIGLGSGPFVAGLLLGGGAGFAAVEWMTISLLCVSFVLLAIPMTFHHLARARPAASPA